MALLQPPTKAPLQTQAPPRRRLLPRGYLGRVPQPPAAGAGGLIPVVFIQRWDKNPRRPYPGRANWINNKKHYQPPAFCATATVFESLSGSASVQESLSATAAVYLC